jgi:curli biogenesis system outer membrane secretion channel CsgG
MKALHIIIALILLSSYFSSHAQQNKKTVAVLDFNSSSKEIQSDELQSLSTRFRSMLVKTQVYNVLERGKMDDILKEKNFILSDNCRSEECAVQVGQLLGADHIITGTIGKVGTLWTLDIRLIDITTGKIAQTVTQDVQGEMEKLVGVMNTMANAIAGIHTVKKTEISASVLDLSFEIKKAGPVKIEIFSILGDKMITLVNQTYEAGMHKVSWDGLDKNGKTADKGVYLYILEMGGKKTTNKFTIDQAKNK